MQLRFPPDHPRRDRPLRHWLSAAPLLILACAHTATAPSSGPEPTTPVSDEARLGRLAYVLGCPREQVTGQEHKGSILAEGCDRLAVFQTREDGSLELKGRRPIAVDYLFKVRMHVP